MKMFNHWRNKYDLAWCQLCDCASITCPVCGKSSCSGSSCPACHADFDDFGKLPGAVEDYLGAEEILVAHKLHALKAHIIDSLGAGESRIDWQQRYAAGKLSDYDRQMFLVQP